MRVIEPYAKVFLNNQKNDYDSSITIRFVISQRDSLKLLRLTEKYNLEYTFFDNKPKKEGVTFIKPSFNSLNEETLLSLWHTAMKHSEDGYTNMITNGATPEQASIVLSDSKQTEIIITALPEVWMKIFQFVLTDPDYKSPQIFHAVLDCLIKNLFENQEE